MAGDFQERVQLLTIPFDWHLSSATNDELALLVVPHGRNMQVEILSVGVTGRDVGTGALTARAEWRDCLTTGAALETVANSFVATNVATQRTFDADGATLATSADVLGTLIADLQVGLPLPLYTLTNITRALSHNSNGNSQTLLDDQIAQLITDINEQRLVDVVFSNTAVDRQFDANSTTVLELADIVQNLHDDLSPTVYLNAAANLVDQGIEGYFSLWNGSQIMEQGDALNLEITNSAGTDKEGYAAIVEYRVKRHSGV